MSCCFYFSLFTFHLNVILLQNYHFSPFHPINYDTYNKKKRSLQHFSHFLQRKSPPRSRHNYQVDSFTSYYLPLTIHDSACEPGTRSWHLPPSTGCRWSWGTPGWSATWYPRRWRFLPTTGPRTRLGTFYSQAGNILFPRWEQHKTIRNEYCAIRVGYWTIRAGYWRIRDAYR